ncbi:MAG: heme-binding domain-containing protein [Anaerolineae bacterium]|nr:heme-binding domain-containing protein [Anaerolineae bacterium]
MKTRKVLLIVGGVLIAGFVILQIIPVGNFIPELQFPGNPPVVQAIQWDSPQTEDLLRRACFDCHSNESEWPWYSHIAPVSWLVMKDVNEARRELNFSNLNLRSSPGRFVRDVEEHIHTDMPPQIYLVMHPNAALTDAEKQQLLDGLTQSLTASAAGSSPTTASTGSGSTSGDQETEGSSEKDD